MTHCRLESGLARHHKTLALAVALGVSRHEALGLIADLWCWVLEVRPGGVLDGVARESLELAVDWRGDRGALATALIACGWIDETAGGGLQIHDWIERATGYRKAKADAKHRFAKRRERIAGESHANRTRIANGSRAIRVHDREERRGEDLQTTSLRSVVSPAAAPDAALGAPPVLTFPCVSGLTWDLSAEQVEKWGQTYPGVDVLAECRKALAWIEAHHPKTKRGMPAFLVSWLGRANDRGPSPGPGSGRRLSRAEEQIHAVADLARETLAREAQARERSASPRPGPLGDRYPPKGVVPVTDDRALETAS